MDRNPANDLKDTMWHFLMDGGQKENIPALKVADTISNCKVLL